MFLTDNIVQETIRDVNSRRILNLLRNKRQLKKQEIAQNLGLSIPTVISNVNDLIAEGLLEEAGVAGSTGGRKPVIIQFRADARYSFGVEITPDKGRVILTDLDCTILEDKSFPLGELPKYEDLSDRICLIIEDMIKHNDLKKQKILGVGFSLPGTVNEEKLILENAPNIKIGNMSFQKLQEKIGLPVYMENDANVCVFAESALGDVKDMNNLVYVEIAKGIGTGIVIKDYLYKGKNKRAGIFGHMTVVPHGKPCNCGKEGCWEVYASERGLLEGYREESGETLAGVDAFFEKIKQGETAALKALDKYLDYLAIGIQNIILVLDPDYVILGGNLSKYKNLFFEQLLDKVFICNDLFKKSDTKVLFSKLEENASILGASLLSMQKLFYLNMKII